MNDTKELLFEQQGQIGILTFNRPEARNALTFAMYESLATHCESILDKSLDLKALIITGAGNKAFAAGTDISQFRNFSSPDDALAYERSMDRVLGVLESVPIPTIAAIRGACTGGGAAIAACCDLRIASDDIKYGFPIARTLGNRVGNRALVFPLKLVVISHANHAGKLDLVNTSNKVGNDISISRGRISRRGEAEDIKAGAAD